jgi:hypothetical protein
VSNRGNVRGIKGKILKPWKCSSGYLEVYLGRGNPKLVHRLVALSFISADIPGKEVAHLNGCRTDNRKENLAWATRKENMQHAKNHGTISRGAHRPLSKLTEKDVKRIRILLEEGIAQNKIGLLFGVSQSIIHRIHAGKSWRHV